MVNKYKLEQHILINRKKDSYLNFFWLGVILYIFFYSLTDSPNPNYKIIQFFQIIGLGLIFYGGTHLISLKFDSTYLKGIYKLFVFWLLLTIPPAFTTDYEAVKVILFDSWFGVFTLFVPLVLLFPRNLFFYKKAFDATIILGVLCLVLNLLYLNYLLDPDPENLVSKNMVETFSTTLALSCNFILLTHPYHSKKRIMIALGIIGLIVFFALIRGRRSLTVIAFLPLLWAYFIYLKNSRAKIISFLFPALLGVAAISYGLNIFQNSDRFEIMRERALADTRSGVENSFYRDMGTLDWVIGRGLDGKYYCPGIDGDPTGMRRVIETGYLNMVLKTGLIGVVLWLLIAIPAIFKGLFRSRNTLSKAAAIWVLLGLLYNYPITINTFTSHYVWFWLSIGICYSGTIRNLPESFLKEYFQVVRT